MNYLCKAEMLQKENSPKNVQSYGSYHLSLRQLNCLSHIRHRLYALTTMKACYKIEFTFFLHVW